MDITNTPIFGDLPPEEQQALLAMGQRRAIPAGEALFVENDPSPVLYMHLSGRCAVSRNAIPMGDVRRHDLLDLAATLGGLPHTVRAVALSDCEFLGWPMNALWQSPVFAAVARQYLASTLLEARSRLDELAAPIHYLGDSAQLPPGPFIFKNVTLIIALCDANLDFLRDELPEGLSLFRPPWRKRDSLFLAMADFPSAYPDHNPSARFAYTETTFFVPVRYRGKLGLFPPYIYPSAYEPILLGREIYGFPKRLGYTVFGEGRISLSVDGTDFVDFTYGQTEPVGEPRLVRALSDWMGVPGRVTETAFRIGDALLDTMGIPLFRRVSVYNHKRIASVQATKDSPAYAVNALTQAIFSVTYWQGIARIPDGGLTVRGGPLTTASPESRDAFLTRLDMRLSTGRVLRDYLK